MNAMVTLEHTEKLLNKMGKKDGSIEEISITCSEGVKKYIKLL